MKWDGQGFILVFDGLTTLDDINDANGKLQGLENFDRHKYQIWNLLNADLSTITTTEIKEPAAYDWAASLAVPNVKATMVGTEQAVIELWDAYVEQSKKMGSPWNFERFSNFSDALKWSRT